MNPADILTLGVMRRLHERTAAVRGLPGQAYGRAFYEHEQRKLFPRAWCVAALASDLPNPGNVVPVDLAGWPPLLVRGADMEVRAFHNLCRHRAMRLVNEPRNVGRALACPWHAWRYGLDGALLATPRVGGEKKHALGLVRSWRCTGSTGWTASASTAA